MSYAEAAAKGPKQSPEELLEALFNIVCLGGTSRAKLLPARSHTSASTLSLIKYQNQILTPQSSRAPAPPQVERSDDSVHSLIDVDSPHISSVPSDFESQSIKTDTQAERIQFEDEAKEAADKARAAKEKAKAKSSRGKQYAQENANNPVFIGNAVTVGVLGTVIGVGAYRKWVRDELSWKVVGAWAGVVGLFGVADYYVSQYFFKKYPPKK